MALHESVLLKEVLEYLDPSGGQTVVDGTLGAGGHAKAVLERLGPQGKLIAFDKDPDALREAQKVLDVFGGRAMLIHSDFKNIAEKMHDLGIKEVSGLLLDLGVSSMQLDNPKKGFSFQADGPLDMRMDPTQELTAEILVNEASKDKLRDILWNLGEERFCKRIVDGILKARDRRRIQSTNDLAAIIWESVPPSYRHRKLHPSTRTFQALRLAVNHELETLESFLGQSLDCLAKGGRLVIISFHSLEDRIVKTAFRKFKQEEKGSILTKKPARPTEEEVERNPRSRSAKLRAFQKS